MKKKVLVIEDSKDIAGLVTMHLKDMNCDVNHAADGNEGLEEAESKNYDLVILDLMLPGLDGLEICRQLRSKEQYTPILMLTARSTEVDRVVGLEMGADDYLVKPFSISELLARVKAIFRRVEAFSGKPEGKQQTINHNDLHIDIDARSVTIAGRHVDLTSKEFDLLTHFARHPGWVYTRAQLLDTVWGYGHEGYEHTVNSHINRLRAKIEKDPSKPNYVLTVWGVGYKFNDQLEPSGK